VVTVLEQVLDDLGLPTDLYEVIVLRKQGKAPSTDAPRSDGEESFATWRKDVVLSILLERGMWSTDHATFLLSCRDFDLG
jgi:hypothetical protein